MVKSFLGLLQSLGIVITKSPVAAGPSGAGLNDEAICAPASGERSEFRQVVTAPSGIFPDGSFLPLSFPHRRKSRTSCTAFVLSLSKGAPRRDYTLLTPRTWRCSAGKDVSNQIYRIRDVNRDIAVGVSGKQRRWSLTA